MDFEIKIDTKSLQQLMRLHGFETYLEPELHNALILSGDLLARVAASNGRRIFIQNSPGGLAESIFPHLISSYELEIRESKPYGRRRDYGFSGRTDSLGRYYPHDPAKPYLSKAARDEQPTIKRLFEDAVRDALGRVAI